MKVAFYTLGCKVNQYETNAMAQKFMENNYKIVPFEEKTDIYVINTCTVTSISDKKSRQILRRAKQLNKNSIVVAIGCYAEVAKEELNSIEEIDLVLGNNEKSCIVEIIKEFIAERMQNCFVSDVNKQKEYLDFGITTYTEKTRAIVKVQDGCNNFCSYCMIPYARGRIRSRNPQSVIEEIKQIVKQGIQEVVITGIHVASYGKDFKEEYTLINLLEDINRIEGLKRIRLGSLEPKIITEEFTKRLKNLDKFCEHFHLSLQSGCDETLKRMNRKYTTEEFRKCVQILRKTFSNVALTTDIIVGFPSETKEEFNNTYKFLEEIKFAKMHIFKYSVRKGTLASKMQNQINPKLKEERSHKLLELSDKNEKEFLKNMIGINEEVLFEEQEGEYFKGHTKNYMLVKAKGDNLENKIIKVNMYEIENLQLIGTIC